MSKNAEAPVPSPGAENVRWNLDDLVAAPAEQGIDAILAEAARRAEAFAALYRGRIAALTAGEMRGLLTEYEKIIESVGRAESYASLSWSTASSDPARGALLQKVSESQARLTQAVVFLDIEWAHSFGGGCPEAHRRPPAFPVEALADHLPAIQAAPPDGAGGKDPR